MKSPAYIFDLDGTVADLSHRLHHVKDGNRRWDLFHAEVGNDLPHNDVLEVCYQLTGKPGQPFAIFCSGRKEVCREATQEWLYKYYPRSFALFMRQDNDNRKDCIVKEELYRKFIEPGFEVLGVFDDRQQVVDMWRSIGLRCYQVAKGDF